MGLSFLGSLGRDVRFASRMIRKHPWFSAAIVLTLALGIGINTAVFTLVNAVLYKPLPFPGGERLVIVRSQELTGNRFSRGVSFPDYRDFLDSSASFERLEAASGMRATLSERGNPPDRYRAMRVSAGLFGMLSVQPALGRPLSVSDTEAGAEPVLWVSDAVWRSRYGSDPDVVGRVVRLDGEPATIAGVMPPGFHFPQNEDLWLPLIPGADAEDREARPLLLFGLLQPGGNTDEAAADLNVIASRLATQFPDTNENLGAVVLTFHEDQNGGNVRSVFLLMMAAVGIVLLIACANVANMMLSRSEARGREVSTRAAMGASRWQLARQFLVESVMLSVLGGLLGLCLASYGANAFDRAVAGVSGKPYWIDFSLDYVVFAYFAGVCVFSGLLFGLAPALRASKVNLSSSLKEGSRSAGSKRGGKLSGALVILQCTAAVVLLSAAGLFIQGLFRSTSLYEGMPVDQVLTAEVSLPGDRYPEAADRWSFYERLLPVVESLPGVRQAGLTTSLPGNGSGRNVEIEGAPSAESAELPRIDVVWQTPDGFRLLDRSVIDGRDFSPTDGLPGREAAIVTTVFSERFWPGQQPLGKRFRIPSDEDPGPWITVVGVSNVVIPTIEEEAPPPLVFLPLRQNPSPYFYLTLRTSVPPASMVSAVRAEVQRLDQDLPLTSIRTLDEAFRQQWWYFQVFGTMFGVFGLMALLIAAVGLYAVIAQSTGRRTQEIGIRMALGATSKGILGLVLKRGLLQLGVGLALGAAGAYATTKLFTSMLSGLVPSGPGMLLGVSCVLAAVGLFACWLPAYRAARLHPVTALRHN